MSTEAWTLAGVVVGAIAAGLAQVGNSWLLDRQTTKRRREELRRDAYVNFLEAATVAAQLAPSSSGYAQAIRRLQSAQARVALVASPEVMSKSVDLMLHMQGDKADDTFDTVMALSWFTKMAKKDLES